MGVLRTADSNKRGGRRGRVGWLATLCAGATVVLGVTWSVAQFLPTPVELVSVNVEGRAGNAASSGPAVNDDGSVVAFFSDASDLVYGDTNEARDVFVRDRRLSRTERVSVSSNGTQGNLPSHAAGDNPSLNGDGNVVAFYSDATNLVPGDTNGQTDVFVRLRREQQTLLISVDSSGKQGNGPSLNPSIDASGRYVAFQSLADNLVPGDTNRAADVFVRDRAAAHTERICNTVQGNGASFLPSISDDGNVVAFTSAATNFSEIDRNYRLDIYVCDRRTNEIELISVNDNGVIGNGDSILPVVSADGRYVAFKSLADNLVAGDNNGLVDVFVRDRLNRKTERVSISFLNRDSNAVSYAPDIDCEGRFVAYGSEANNLLRGDVNHLADVFLRDRTARRNFLVDVSESGEQADGSALDIAPAVTCTNLQIAYATLAANLTRNDFNEHADVYIQAAPIPSCQRDADCNDGNACTVDRCGEDGRCVFAPLICEAADSCHEAGICDPATGLCSDPVKPDGAECDDQNLCTYGDFCTAGVCAGTAKDCSTADECHDAGVCDPATGLCPNARPDGTPCDDANLCTRADACQGSICIGAKIDCSTADACHDAGVCNPNTGLCPNPRPDGTPCTDNDLCTTADHCEDSLCIGKAKDCSTADECHDAGSCDPETGLCPNPRSDDTPCNDGNRCTMGDRCIGSICEGFVKDCSVADACHDAGICDPNTGLCPNPRPDGTTCDDKNLCTTADQCQESVCLGTERDCSVADQCHDAGRCNPATGLCPNAQPDGTPCSDQNLCTIGDHCIGSFCAGSPKNCSIADGCHDAGACNPVTGLCPNARPDGAICNDGNPCTTEDQCLSSICTGNTIDCSIGTDCHDPGLCDPNTGMCPNPRPDGTPCSDHDLCTIGDQCVNSHCLGSRKDCSVADGCHDVGLCEPSTGLCPNPKPNGTACNDQNLCTQNDQCLGSLCTGTVKDCSTANDCHDAGQCNPATGRCPGSKPDGASCNDSNLCTLDDRCSNDSCEGTPKDCSAANDCHEAGECNAATGRCPASKPDGTACNDANLCTSNDQCRNDVCTGTVKDCSIPDPCHDIGECNPATGLCPGSKPDGTPCQTNNFCVVNENCSEGLCEGQPRDCDDGLFCNGIETCNAERKACVSSGNPCAAGAVCDEDTRTCVNADLSLDKDACNCNLDPAAPRTRTAAWLWLSAAGVLLMRRHFRRRVQG